MINAKEARKNYLLSDNKIKIALDYLDKMITKMSKEGKTRCMACFKMTDTNLIWQQDYVSAVEDELVKLGYETSMCSFSSINVMCISIRWCDATLRVNG